MLAMNSKERQARAKQNQQLDSVDSE